MSGVLDPLLFQRLCLEKGGKGGGGRGGGGRRRSKAATLAASLKVRGEPLPIMRPGPWG